MLAFKNLKIDTALLARVDDLKKQVDALKPLPKDVEGKIWQKYRLDWNYHSNAIEGNSLTFGETLVFLREGLTAKGKPLKDHLDMKGHNEVVEYLFSMIHKKDELTEKHIKEFHKILLVEPYEVNAVTLDGQKSTKTIKIGEYKSQSNHVLTPTGDTHYYATPDETPGRMGELIEWHRREKDTLHPVILAALLHYEFVNIHPFDDGNGRMSRILMNLVLLQNGYPPVVIKKADRNEYYAALAQADAKNYEPFIELIAINLIHSLEIYIKGAKGEDISEPDDVDKEIELLKKSFSNDRKVVLTINSDSINKIIKDTIGNTISEVDKKLSNVKDLFATNIIVIEFDYNFNHPIYNDEPREINLDRFLSLEKYDWLCSEYATINTITYNCFLSDFKLDYKIDIKGNYKIHFQLYSSYYEIRVVLNISSDINTFDEIVFEGNYDEKPSLKQLDRIKEILFSTIKQSI